jgi:HTH-type transcriptional regulator, competence development regulator
VAAYIEADAALVSKLERSERKAHKDQVVQIARYLGANENELVVLWLADKIADSIDGEDLGMEAIRFIEQDFKR